MPCELGREWTAPELPEAVDGVVGEVLATMFFSDAEPARCEHGWIADAACVGVRFEGSHWGQVHLAVAREAVEPVASAFLGLDAGADEAERLEVVLELANILCGAVLSRIWPESRLQLSAPEAALWPGEEACSLHRCFEMPEGRLAFCVRVEGPAAV
jgi:hypothetical protein